MRSLMGTCVLNSNRHLISQGVKSLRVFRKECFCFRALYIQDANDLPRISERQSQLGTGIGKVRVIFERRIFLHIQGDARIPRRGNVTDDSYLPHLETMPTRQHSPPAFAVGGSQDRIFTLIIQKEDAYVVETELLADHLGKPE